MSESAAQHVRPPDWGPGLDYWVPDGEPDPDIPWPENFEVCGVPDYVPELFGKEPKRPCIHVMAWPMFDINDPVRAIDVFCLVLEQMSPAAREHWYALPERFLHIAAADLDMDASRLDSDGFVIPGDMIRRIRQLRIRLQVTLHPHSQVKVSSGC